MLLLVPSPLLTIAGCAYVLLTLQQSWRAQPVHQTLPKLHEVQVRVRSRSSACIVCAVSQKCLSRVHLHKAQSKLACDANQVHTCVLLSRCQWSRARMSRFSPPTRRRCRRCFRTSHAQYCGDHLPLYASMHDAHCSVPPVCSQPLAACSALRNIVSGFMHMMVTIRGENASTHGS